MTTLERAAEERWDAIVIGAGPAGSVVAQMLVRRQHRVLLVDKAAFPRDKVCGCFLARAAVQTLESHELFAPVRRLNAPIVDRVRIGSGGRVAALDLPAGLATSRRSLDTVLIEAAVAAGAAFLPKTKAQVSDAESAHRAVELNRVGEQRVARARLVIVADGIAGHALHGSREIEYCSSRRSLIGAAAITDSLPENYVPGTIHMAVGRGGYVGCLQTDDGRLDLAAALDPRLVRSVGLTALARSICISSGLPPIEGLDQLHWRGTPPLTRTPSAVGGDRLLLVGDAAGYVEPFTGEGMSWAIASATALAPIASQAIAAFDPALVQRWKRVRSGLLGNRARACRVLTGCLRSPLLTGLIVTLLKTSPGAASPLVSWLGSAPRLDLTDA